MTFPIEEIDMTRIRKLLNCFIFITFNTLISVARMFKFCKEGRLYDNKSF